MRGALDDLAWALHFESEVLGLGGEDERDVRTRCNLFDERFLAPLAKKHTALAETIRAKNAWYGEFKKLRDPIAHRVPLYIAPAVIREDSDDEKRLRGLEKEMAAAIARGDNDTAFGSMIESQSVGKFEAWFARSDSGGQWIHDLSKQVEVDELHLLDIGEAVLGALEAGPAVAKKI